MYQTFFFLINKYNDLLKMNSNGCFNDFLFQIQRRHGFEENMGNCDIVCFYYFSIKIYMFTHRQFYNIVDDIEYKPMH